jgi:hypothetical protein
LSGSASAKAIVGNEIESTRPRSSAWNRRRCSSALATTGLSFVSPAVSKASVTRAVVPPKDCGSTSLHEPSAHCLLLR